MLHNILGPSPYLFRLCQRILTYELDSSIQVASSTSVHSSRTAGITFSNSVADVRLVCVGILRSLFNRKYFHTWNNYTPPPVATSEQPTTIQSSQVSVQSSTAFNVPALPRHAPIGNIRIAQLARLYASVALHDSDPRVRNAALSALIPLPVSMKGLILSPPILIVAIHHIGKLSLLQLKAFDSALTVRKTAMHHLCTLAASINWNSPLDPHCSKSLPNTSSVTPLQSTSVESEQKKESPAKDDESGFDADWMQRLVVMTLPPDNMDSGKGQTSPALVREFAQFCL